MKCNILISAFFIVLMISCHKEDVKIPIDYSTGIFVVNQGPYNSGTGTITFHNNRDTIQDVYGSSNPGQVLGNIAQAMIKFKDKYFISINNGGKVQVVRSKDFVSLGEINPIAGARNFVSDNNKLYVASWGEDRKSGAIYEIDPASLKLSAPIFTGGAPEGMIIQNKKLYVAISSASLDMEKRVVVIDTETNQILKTINTADSPTALIVDKNEDIWVLCSGYFNWDNPALNTKGALQRLKNDQVVATYVLSTGANGLVKNKLGDKLYFLMDNQVLVHDIGDVTFEKESIFDGSFYAIGYDVSKGNIYLADALDYQSAGRVLIINPDTMASGRYRTGIIPGYFYFSE